MQRQGIGTRVLQMLTEEARRVGKPITLGVVKINPARRLYERLGYPRTHEDRHKVYMLRPSASASRTDGCKVRSARAPDDAKKLVIALIRV
jgi:ribosomal protein S18 acetylase RimI-like enzyme